MELRSLKFAVTLAEGLHFGAGRRAALRFRAAVRPDDRRVGTVDQV